MAKKTPPYKNYPVWTQARFFTFIRSALRSASQKWPPRNQSKHLAKRKYTGSNKRQKFEYKCNKCKRWFRGDEVEIDHIHGISPLQKLEDLPKFVDTLFCAVEDFQVLCKGCHGGKTKKRKKEK